MDEEEGTVAPAEAATTKFCTLMQGTSGYGCFHSDGDKFAVEDYIADGKRVVLTWTLINGPQKGRRASALTPTVPGMDSPGAITISRKEAITP